MTSRCLHLFAATLCVASITSRAIPSRADSTVVTETTTQVDVSGANASDLSGIGDLGKPLEIAIAYSKGSRSRYETQDRIILRGLQEGTISVLNPATRTFYVTTEGDEYTRRNNDASGFSGIGVTIGDKDLRANASATPIPGHRTILGLAAKGIHFQFGMNYKAPKGSADGPDYAKLAVDGEFWTSRAVPDYPGDAALPGAPAGVPKAVLSALNGVASEIHGNPLAFKLVFHVLAGDKDHTIKMQLVMRQNIRSISLTSLPNELFSVPGDYHLVQAPAKTSPPADAKPSAAAVSIKTAAAGA